MPYMEVPMYTLQSIIFHEHPLIRFEIAANMQIHSDTTYIHLPAHQMNKNIYLLSWRVEGITQTRVKTKKRNENGNKFNLRIMFVDSEEKSSSCIK